MFIDTALEWCCVGGKIAMDFGDVLDTWNAMDKKKKLKKQTRSEKQSNLMDWWIDQYGVVDKDALAERDDNRKKFMARSHILSLQYDARIDLHGLTVEVAEKRLFQFVSECERRGDKKILIIHGKGIHSHGDSVLGNMVHRFIEQDKRLGMSGHPESSEGGSGATWVILKNNLLN